MSLENPKNFKKMLRKSAASDAWAAIFKTLIFLRERAQGKIADFSWGKSYKIE